jgi:hypothetical protein
MNMKKTIAAAAAGAMAVSATATAASAAATQPTPDTQGTYTYSLVKNFAVEKLGSATVVTENDFTATAANTAIFINLGNADPALIQKNKGTLYIQQNVASNPAVLYNAELKLVSGVASDPRFTMHTDAVIAVSTKYLGAGTDAAFIVRYTADIDVDADSFKDNKVDVKDDYKDADAIAARVKDQRLFAIGHSSAVAETANTFDIANLVGANLTRYSVTAYTKYNAAGLIVKAPLRSSLNAKTYNTGMPNIIAYLEGYNDNPAAATQGYYVADINTRFPSGITLNTAGVKYIGRAEKYVSTVADAGDYVNVMAVLNDTIANYDVKFTFNTAAQPVWVKTDDGDAKTNGKYNGVYHADGDKQYTSFAQNLYGLYGNDASYVPFYATNGSFFTSPGVNYSLFQGGLIVNDTYSMQLADTEIFAYSGTGIAFDMNTIKDNAVANYNSWITYVQSLRLATSTEWYWDNLTITWAAPVEDSVATGEGIGSDEVTLDDEPAAEDEVAVPEAEVEVPVAPNPATGNSAVALAVIPVALAAAAIVAKKRK